MLIEPDCPEWLVYLWDYWAMMDQRRQATSDGIPLPISNVEMESWGRLHRISLDPLEVQALDAIEAMFLAKRGSK